MVNRWFAINPWRDVAAILDELTTEADEESFVIVLQDDRNDVISKVILANTIQFA